MTSSSDSPDETSLQSEPDRPTPSEFSEKMNRFPTPEEKISFGLAFMRESISQEGSPRFREFWESRQLVLPLFKENLNPAIRSKLWGEYVELTIEARRLKEILEEQSAFAMEQIDLAIQAIEGDLSNFETLLSQVREIFFPEACETIQQKGEVYNQVQRELNLLNTLASRLNSLRKEIIKTDMRIRFKTKFFKRISGLGDQIFPKRKELIERVSSEFEKDIEHFVASYFQDGETINGPYYALREEIKALQGMAKVLTLNSSVFNRTRLLLSECWDKIKILEKEHKKVIHERRQASSAVSQEIYIKIEELKTRSAELTLRDLDREIDGIVREMRMRILDRDDVRALRDELAKLRAPHVAATEQKARELEEAEREKLRLKKEKVVSIKDRVNQLSKDAHELDLNGLVSQFEELSGDIEKLDASKMEKQQLERQLRPLKDLLAEKKEQALLNLSEDDKKTLENLRLVLLQKKERRQEIKNHIETYRKALGSSNLDFEKAMMYSELVEQEKELLEKANAGIEEIERKIAEVEG